jgi:hypothetical protein
MTRRLHVWWLSAVAVAATLTTPKVTPETSDDAFEGVLRGSRIFGAFDHASRIVRAAWRDARVGAWSRRLRAALAVLPGADRVRVAGGSIATAGVTALVLRMASPPVASLTWVLPLVFALAGCAAVVAAEAIVRAVAAKIS